MRNREPLMTTIKHIKAEGYQVDIMIMAINDQLSRAGIAERYEDKKADGTIARWTPIEIHDAAYMDIPATVAAIEQESPIDSISVYNRAGGLLYGNGREGTFKRPSLNDSRTAESTLLEERALLSDKEKERLKNKLKESLIKSIHIFL